jgi:hypothetical protein
VVVHVLQEHRHDLDEVTVAVDDGVAELGPDGRRS